MSESFLNGTSAQLGYTVPFGDYAEGHAVQVWCLLHLLPVILCDVVDVEHEAWRLCLLLREIVELICVPKVSDAQVLFLNLPCATVH